MGKRQPHSCPVYGCDKTGTLSSLKQHFRHKHGDTLPEGRLAFLIINGEKIAMPITKETVATLHPDFSKKRLLPYVALAFGILLGAAGALYVQANHYANSDCPESIKRVISVPKDGR